MDEENRLKLLNDDVLYLMSLVGKKIRIQTVENEFVEGVVFVIDPIYKTIVLDDDEKIRIIILLSIKTMEEISKDVVRPEFLEKPKPRDIGSWKDLESRSERILKWLKMNYISAEKKGETIIIDDHVTLEPPYTEETCYCTSTVVLQNIRKILGMMPNEF